VPLEGGSGGPGDFTQDGTYVSFIETPRDRSLTGTPETHDIHGYMTLHVYV